MDSHHQPLLTIAVPTYNRASFLARSLTSIVGQAAGYPGKVELLVFDNCSTDATAATVESFIAAGHRISFSVNPANLGPDGNFVRCYQAARGKYFLLFSDDDILLDGALDKLIPALEADDYGVLFMDPYFFHDDPAAERPRRRQGGLEVFDDHAKFVKAVNIWFTFISSNIVNRELLGSAIDLEDFANTNLVQLGWIFPALFKARKNAYFRQYLVAAQSENSGGYKFCDVFGRKLNRVFDILIAKYGCETRYFKIINRLILKRHLSKYIMSARQEGYGSFHKENFSAILKPVFQSYPSYWVFIHPSINWPLPAAKIWCKVCRRFAKLTGTL